MPTENVPARQRIVAVTRGLADFADAYTESAVTVPEVTTGISLTGLGRVVVAADENARAITIRADDVTVERLEAHALDRTALAI